MRMATAYGAVAEWPLRRWAAVAIAMVLSLLFVGLPTTLVPNPIFTRMTAIRWWDWPIWILTALLTGLLVGSYLAGTQARRARRGGIAATSGVLSTLAVGCPVCNKLVIAAVGTAGALNLWAPIQPVLGVLSLGLLAAAFHRSVVGRTTCPLPTVDLTASEPALTHEHL